MFNPLGAGLRWAQEVGQVGDGDVVAVLGPGLRGLCSAVAAQEAGAVPLRRHVAFPCRRLLQRLYRRRCRLRGAGGRKKGRLPLGLCASMPHPGGCDPARHLLYRSSWRALIALTVRKLKWAFLDGSYLVWSLAPSPSC